MDPLKRRIVNISEAGLGVMGNWPPSNKDSFERVASLYTDTNARKELRLRAVCDAAFNSGFCQLRFYLITPRLERRMN